MDTDVHEKKTKEMMCDDIICIATIAKVQSAVWLFDIDMLPIPNVLTSLV